MSVKILGKSAAFYDTYERRPGDNKEQTHYCPGCGHGILHKLIAEALLDYDVADGTPAATEGDHINFCTETEMTASEASARPEIDVAANQPLSQEGGASAANLARCGPATDFDNCGGS